MPKPAPPSAHPFPCRTCKKSFTAAAAMEAHHAAVHMGPSGTPFQCGMCSKPFGEKAWLEQHCRDAHPGHAIGTKFLPLPATLVCPHCSAPLRSDGCLEKHIQMKHPAKARPPESKDYKNITNGFLAQWKKPGTPTVDNVLILPIPQSLRNKYESYKSEVKNRERQRTAPSLSCTNSGNEVVRYHGTSLECQLGVAHNSTVCNSGQCNCCNILKSGFKTTKSGARGFNRFGLGLYSTSVSSKAHDYNSASENGLGQGKRAMLVCKVVAGRSYSTKTSSNYRESTAPPEGHDSILGIEGKELNHDELVVYDSMAMIATYLILYSY